MAKPKQTVLWRLQQRLGATRDEMAEALGIHPLYWRAIRNGTREVSKRQGREIVRLWRRQLERMGYRQPLEAVLRNAEEAEAA